MIEKIVKDKYYKDLCHKCISNPDLANDLLQFTLLQFLEKPKERQKEILNGNYKSYIARMIWLNAVSKNSPFWKIYDDNSTDIGLPDIADTESNHEYYILKEEVLKVADEVIQMEIERQDKEGKYHWNVTLFRYYFESDASMHDLSRRTGVPYPTIRYNINDIIKLINERINHNSKRDKRS